MAKRLVSTALGIKNTVSPEQRKVERQMLADAKRKRSEIVFCHSLCHHRQLAKCVCAEKKRLAAQQKEAAWEGTLAAP